MRARSGAARVWAALDRPRLWRATAALSALLICFLLLAASQGSLTVIADAPPPGASGRASPSWLRWCASGSVRQDRRRLAFCARVDGHVISSSHGPSSGEIHLAVLTDFHLVIVRPADGTPTPSWGSRIVAVGPLLRARDGQREVQAFTLDVS